MLGRAVLYVGAAVLGAVLGTKLAERWVSRSAVGVLQDNLGAARQEAMQKFLG